MGAILRPVKRNKDKEIIPEKTVHVSNSKIDREGVAWEKKSTWLRQDYVGKLKVIAHFEGKTFQQLIDEALAGYLKERWDSTTARKKLVRPKDKK